MEVYKKYLNENKKEELENLIRDNLSGTDRKTDKELLFNLVKRQMKVINQKLFDQVFDKLVDDGYLKKLKDDTYIWEM